MGCACAVFSIAMMCQVSVVFVVSNLAPCKHLCVYAGCKECPTADSNLWTNGSVIHAGEFYHGPIEIVQAGRPHFVCLLGEDPARPAVERVVRFLDHQGTPHYVFDSRAYGRYSELMAPFPLFMATERWVMEMAARAGHDVDARRYMGKVSAVWGEF